MDVSGLSKAIDTLIKEGVDTSEVVCLKVGEGYYTVTGVTVVVESDDWVPGTVVLTVEEIEDS